jgi:hypothetical protein
MNNFWLSKIESKLHENIKLYIRDELEYLIKDESHFKMIEDAVILLLKEEIKNKGYSLELTSVISAIHKIYTKFTYGFKL